MRVLYINQYFSTRRGSAITRSYELALRLVDRGHEVTMVCGSYTGTESGLEGPIKKGVRRGDVDGIDVIQFDAPLSNNDGFGARKKAFIEFAFKCIGPVLREPYDLIFVTSPPLTVAIPGIVGKLLRRKPLVFEVRDPWPEAPRALGVIKNPIVLKLLEGLESLSYSLANHCIGLSPGVVKRIMAKGKPHSCVAMIPNACDTDMFNPSARRHFSCVPGVEQDDFVAVFAGAHGMANGLEAIVDAGRVLKQRGIRDIKLVFIGQGMMKQSLIETCRHDGIDNCVFMDSLPKVELARLLPNADAGLMVLSDIPIFYYSSSPNKFFDYISCGLPVVVNYPGWVADMITDQDCGIVVPPRDPESFADALVWLRNNREKCKRMGQNARSYATSSFDRDDLANQFVDALEHTYQQRQCLRRPR